MQPAIRSLKSFGAQEAAKMAMRSGKTAAGCKKPGPGFARLG